MYTTPEKQKIKAEMPDKPRKENKRKRDPKYSFYDEDLLRQLKDDIFEAPLQQVTLFNEPPLPVLGIRPRPHDGPNFCVDCNKFLGWECPMQHCKSDGCDNWMRLWHEYHHCFFAEGEPRFRRGWILNEAFEWHPVEPYQEDFIPRNPIQ